MIWYLLLCITFLCSACLCGWIGLCMGIFIGRKFKSKKYGEYQSTTHMSRDAYYDEEKAVCVPHNRNTPKKSVFNNRTYDDIIFDDDEEEGVFSDVPISPSRKTFDGKKKMAASKNNIGKNKKNPAG